MIISFNGNEGSGKSTISKLVAKNLDYPHYYTGKIFRDIAKNRNMTLADLHQLCEKDASIDKEVDNYVIRLGIDTDDFVIDSRMAWYFIPKSLKIYLTVDDEVAAKRIFSELQHDSSRNEGDDLNSEKDVLDRIRTRNKQDDDRYFQLYGQRIHDESQYDFVLDTTNLTIEQVLEKTMDFISLRLNVKPD